MILVVLIALLFFRSAKKRNLIPWLWAVLGGLSYFIGQFLAGVVLALGNSDLLYGDEFDLILPALVGGILTVAVTYGIMELVARNKSKQTPSPDTELLDDNYLDKP